ncbi:hypothetical protein [Paenibacillus polymyxa]|uniref:Uncharacterized protein n=1 Tax=Paenibacillus polymyxa (strain SC2) TaxID=886882 RepID=E3EKY9_PAEPS|nr:hypothetical protein [Paenibacillus polymyxa]ADO59894.1 hypothetical protein PPSC2_28690 [Paenibacillus polymyxa SC2]WPQ59881.1 hypothetical protein SKN87_26705 [Paenibacillus polymyxa]
MDTDVLQTAKRKARYGHRDWVYWKDENGDEHTEVKSSSSVKKAMISVGSKGRYFVVCANNGNLMLGNWRMGITMINNTKYGI